jgi:hypothetical protein
MTRMSLVIQSVFPAAVTVRFKLTTLSRFAGHYAEIVQSVFPAPVCFKLTTTKNLKHFNINNPSFFKQKLNQ